jgi:hypothetical protein
MNKYKRQILDNCTRIRGVKLVSQHLYNEGLNEGHLQFEKNTLLFDSIRNHEELIKVKKEYPKNDIQDIELDLDLVVMTRDQFDKIFSNE